VKCKEIYREGKNSEALGWNESTGWNRRTLQTVSAKYTSTVTFLHHQPVSIHGQGRDMTADDTEKNQHIIGFLSCRLLYVFARVIALQHISLCMPLIFWPETIRTGCSHCDRTHWFFGQLFESLQSFYCNQKWQEGEAKNEFEAVRVSGLSCDQSGFCFSSI